jgi:general secretion pathway protein G
MQIRLSSRSGSQTRQRQLTDGGAGSTLVHEAEATRPRASRRGYATSKDLVDPWRRRSVERPGQNNPHSYDLYSFGSDGVQGGDADVGNWEQAQN